MSYSRIQDLNKNEKPREKLLIYGAKNLTDEELVAILLGSGGKHSSAIDVARDILKAAGGLQQLPEYDFQKLISHKYINTARASIIKAVAEISHRISTKTVSKRFQLSKPADVYKYLKKDLFGQRKEHLVLLSIDSRNRLISKDVISIGSLNETIVSPREIFCTALSKNAACIIIAHNHPSNDPTPSAEDIKVTERIAKLGREMNVPLLDHVVITDNTYVSMKQLNIFTTFDKEKTKGGDKNEQK